MPTTTAIAPWFGCARMMAEEVGNLLKGCRWVGIPFAGGMPEVLKIDAPTIVVSDLHRHVINLANVMKDRFWGARLYRSLRRLPFHPEVLAESQTWCKKYTDRPAKMGRDMAAAFHYFVTCWMGCSGKSGIMDEFNGGISVRWNISGGDSAVRYHSAVRSIIAWRRVLRRCTLVVMDCFDFLDACQDEARHGIYCDPPFPGPGAKYRHTFTETDHRQLAMRLAEFTRARVVCRFYDHPLIRELYPTGQWTWHEFSGRKQSNAAAPEVLLTNDKQRSLF